MYHMVLVIVDRSPEQRSNPLYAFSLQGGLGVQIFFVISGFCIANAMASALRKERSLATFVWARARRLYPPCWVALFLAAALSLATYFLVQAGVIKASLLAQQDLLHQSFLYFFSNLTLTAIFFGEPLLLVICWTLCYEVCFYALVALWIPFQKRLGGERGILNALHVLTFSIMCILIFAPAYKRFPFDLWPQFGLGVLVYDVLRHPQQVRPKIWLTVLCTQFIAFIVWRNYSIGAWPNPSRLTFLVCLVFAVQMLVVHRWDETFSALRPVRWMSAIGLFSYSLYLTHVLSLGVIHQGVKLLHLSEHSHLLQFALGVGLSVLIARVFFEYFERPFMSSGIRQKKQAESVSVETLPEKLVREGVQR
jgi:peptidoglycan/LPS O-acetylase OafA/YrhL